MRKRRGEAVPGFDEHVRRVELWDDDRTARVTKYVAYHGGNGSCKETYHDKPEEAESEYILRINVLHGVAPPLNRGNPPKAKRQKLQEAADVQQLGQLASSLSLNVVAAVNNPPPQSCNTYIPGTESSNSKFPTQVTAAATAAVHNSQSETPDPFYKAAFKPGQQLELLVHQCQPDAFFDTFTGIKVSMQVQQQLAHGGNADAYLVQLIGDAGAQAASVSTVSAAANLAVTATVEAADSLAASVQAVTAVTAAGTAADSNSRLKDAVPATATAAQEPKPVQLPGQLSEFGLSVGSTCVLKVGRPLDSYPASERGAVTAAHYAHVVRKSMAKEFFCIKSLAGSPFIVDGYEYGKAIALRAPTQLQPLQHPEQQPLQQQERQPLQQQQQQTSGGQSTTPMACMLLQHADLGSLWDMLQPQGPDSKQPMTADQTWEVMTDVGQALQRVHKQWMIHRDVKPQNVLGRSIESSVRQRRYMLCDLSEVKLASDVDDLGTDFFFGTPAYAPPEQKKGWIHTATLDTFQWGLLLLACRTAEHPFHHLQALAQDEQQRRRTYDEVVSCGCYDHLLPCEKALLKRCLAGFGQREAVGAIMVTDPYFRYRPSKAAASSMGLMGLVG